MLPTYKKKVSILLPPTIFFLVVMVVLNYLQSSYFGLSLIVGIPLNIVTCYYIAKGKGYNGAICLFGIFSVLGLIVTLAMPDKIIQPKNGESNNNNIFQANSEPGVKLNEVWYRSAKKSWINLFSFSMQDIGILTIGDNAIYFNGPKNAIMINKANIKMVSYGKQGTDFTNFWVKIEYVDSEGLNKEAYFADGNSMGWAGIHGGTKHIYELVQQFEK